MAKKPKKDNDLESNEKASDEAARPEGDEALEAAQDAPESVDVAEAETIEGVASEDPDAVEGPKDDDGAFIMTPGEETPEEAREPADPPPLPVAPAATAPPPPPASGGSVWPMLFGGLLAGAIGFLIAAFALPESGGDAPQVADDGLAERLQLTSDELAAQSERLDALQAELGNAPAPAVAPEVDLGPLDEAIATLSGDVAAVSGSLEDLTATLSGLDDRITALEARPAGPDGGAAMEAQLQAFRADLDEVTASARAEIEAAKARASQIEADAAMAAEASAKRAAIADIRAALESGEAFSDALSAVPDAPKELTAVAADGVATLPALQAEFPLLARAALREVQVVPEDASTGDRLSAFLRRQTNARSLAPRDGDDPDAVLSRAEAALNGGDLTTALTELDTLPEEAKSALTDWVSAARSRRDALNAATTLSGADN